jgi:hypothetical protein
MYSIYNTADSRTGKSEEGVAVSSTNTYYSTVISGKHSTVVPAHFSWTGNPTGTLSFWVSDKPQPSLADDTDWVQEATAYTAVNPAGSASKAEHDITSTHRWKRFKYVNASGSGTLYGYVNVSRNA